MESRGQLSCYCKLQCRLKAPLAATEPCNAFRIGCSDLNRANRNPVCWRAGVRSPRLETYSPDRLRDSGQQTVSQESKGLRVPGSPACLLEVRCFCCRLGSRAPKSIRRTFAVLYGVGDSTSCSACEAHINRQSAPASRMARHLTAGRSLHFG